jgi:hypothetical protein
MNRDDIIRMAREAGMIGTGDAGNELERLYREAILDALPRFAALVAAAEREKWKWEELHTCHPHCDRPACVAVRRAREDEREACAKVCDQLGDEYADTNAADCAFAIRERGAP